MAERKKIRVAVLYGGKSSEHEISLRSAASVIRNLDQEKYEIVPIGIDKSGRWFLNSVDLILESSREELLPSFKGVPEVTFLPRSPEVEGKNNLIHLRSGKEADHVDVVFPVMHGPLCEDGTIQGLLELIDLPYVGAGVLGSAVGMDKDVAKRLALSQGIPVGPYFSIRLSEWKTQQSSVRDRVHNQLGYPVFVKPANLGSSVGISRAKTEQDLVSGIEKAFEYDNKVLIEKGLDVREIELAVLQSLDPAKPPLVSIPGEILPQGHDFYSYEAKYLDENGAELIIPAKLSSKEVELAQELGRKVFVGLECEGMARVDLFYDRHSKEFFFNELNTIPGFTKISMYPKLWEASGKPYSELLSHLIQLAVLRHERKKTLNRNY